MAFRRTKGIVSDTDKSDAKKEADVIMTATALGMAASYAKNDKPIQFDIDPRDKVKDYKTFDAVVGKMDKAVVAYLKANKLEPKGKVSAGLAPGYTQGAVIMGVYKLANQKAPPSVSAPVLTKKGQALYDKIKVEDPSIVQYTGRGAYTGFLDNPNTQGNTDPVGPRPTARFLTPDTSTEMASHAPTLAGLHPRWLPPTGHALWTDRLRKGSVTKTSKGTHVPWGLITGLPNAATLDPKAPNTTGATNLADQITIEMRDKYHMVFNGDLTEDDIAAYTHGMIQAIYKGYALGPSCTPYEIAVGGDTTKMASCLTCTFFMVAAGYPPTSIHLGRGESWAPLYEPYNPGGAAELNELAVIRDLNAAWRNKCREWLALGLQVLDDAHIADTHKPVRELVKNYLIANSDASVAATLVLDAVTLHDSESARIGRTLK